MKSAEKFYRFFILRFARFVKEKYGIICIDTIFARISVMGFMKHK